MIIVIAITLLARSVCPPPPAAHHKSETARVLDIASGKRLCVMGAEGGATINDEPGAGHCDKVNGLAWSPDSTRVATVSDDLTVRVWDATDGSEVARLTGRLGTQARLYLHTY